MAAAVSNPAIIEAAQFLADPQVQQTPPAMQMGYLRDVLHLKPPEVIEAQRLVGEIQLQQAQQQLQAQQQEQQQAQQERQRATAVAEQQATQQQQQQQQPEPQFDFQKQQQEQQRFMQQQQQQQQMQRQMQTQQSYGTPAGPSAFSRSSDVVGGGPMQPFPEAQRSKLRAPGQGPGPPQFGGHVWGQQPQGLPRYRRDEQQLRAGVDDTAALLGAGGVFFDGRTTPSQMVEQKRAEVIASCDTRTYGRKKVPLMVQDDGVDMRRNGQTVMSAVLGSGGTFNTGAEEDTNKVKSIITATGAVNTIQEDRHESSQIIEKNRRLAPRGQVAVDRFGTDREIEKARKQTAQAAFIEQQAERDAAMAMMSGDGGGGAGGGDAGVYAPSWNSAALSGEQPGPHTGQLGASGQLNTSQNRRPRSRPTTEDVMVGKPTDLRGGAVNEREKESFQNRIESDAVYQKMRSRQNGGGLW